MFKVDLAESSEERSSIRNNKKVQKYCYKSRFGFKVRLKLNYVRLLCKSFVLRSASWRKIGNQIGRNVYFTSKFHDGSTLVSGCSWRHYSNTENLKIIMFEHRRSRQSHWAWQRPATHTQTLNNNPYHPSCSSLLFIQRTNMSPLLVLHLRLLNKSSNKHSQEKSAIRCSAAAH